MEIRTGGLDHPDVVALLQEHLRGMAELSPPESIHALDLDGLRQPPITFWSAWQDDELMGCGALKQLDADRDFLKAGGVFTDDFIDAYIALKMKEVTAFRAATHPLEYQMYYTI